LSDVVEAQETRQEAGRGDPFRPRRQWQL